MAIRILLEHGFPRLLRSLGMTEVSWLCKEMESCPSPTWDAEILRPVGHAVLSVPGREAEERGLRRAER